MEAVLIVVALIFVLCVVAGLYATVRVARTAKRGVDRTVSQARRAVEDTTLKAKSLAQPGAVGELAALRLSLRSSMRSTQDALAAEAAQDGGLAEAVSLFERLSTHGRRLDDELRRLERDPDKTGLAVELAPLRERTKQIVHSAEALRWAARDRAHRFSGDELDDLREQIDLEAGALRHWTSAGHPGGPATAPPHGADPSGAPADAVSAPALDGSGAESPGTWDRLLKEPRREKRRRS
ncbi:hypothetical protein AB0J21_08055 [Streptomyces sp. NPDC049954]|uniref:hypothetical protein n=1 Tax=Streptomyces sp. NPDC049954 TaxID=3155779 RepID=UPI00343D8152